MSASPDLSTLFVGKDHHHFDSLHSTNDYLKKLNREIKIAEGFTVTSDYQTSGRGQLGNTWESQKGQNLLMSVFLRPTSIKAAEYFFFNMSVCLALADSLNSFHPGFKVKWPNDILFDRRKVAGILIENGIGKNKLSYSIVGIGININQTKWSPEARAVNSLAQITGRPVSLSVVRSIVLKNLEVRYLQLLKGTETISALYYESLYGYGEKVEVEVDGQKQVGEISGVLPDGCLVMQLPQGRRVFQFKEMRFVL